MIHPLIRWQRVGARPTAQRLGRLSLQAAATLHGYVVRAAKRRRGGETRPPRVDVVVTTRTNRAIATCDAPNCAGHRTRA